MLNPVNFYYLCKICNKTKSMFVFLFCWQEIYITLWLEPFIHFLSKAIRLLVRLLALSQSYKIEAIIKCKFLEECTAEEQEALPYDDFFFFLLQNSVREY